MENPLFDDLINHLKTKSYPFYFCFLLAPKTIKNQLAFLWGTAAQIRFIPLQVTHPLIGLMRLTQWREAFLSKGLQAEIEWLNTYEIFFEDNLPSFENWESYLQGEVLLLQQSFNLVGSSSNEKTRAAVKQLGEMMGIIYLLQNEQKFQIDSRETFKKFLKTEFKLRLQTLKNSSTPPFKGRFLFSLIGYCHAWWKRYHFINHPLTLTEPSIQGTLLQQYLKLSLEILVKRFLKKT